ncbi:MAG TPA: hypothetical protein VK364_10040, partial [Hymenobacter sp.]|nr:hypothetical protein [Hymenobacter sp.]
ARFENFYTPKGQHLKTRNTLPAGRYRVTVEVADASGSRLGSETIDLDVTPQQPPLLSYPTDKEQVYTLNPTLQWIPPQPIEGQVYFDLKLVEVQNKQSPLKAWLHNLPLVDLKRLPALQQPYSAQFRNLEYGRTYAWKIAAYDADQTFLGETDVWVFTPVKEKVDTMPEPPVHIATGHWLTQVGGEDGFLVADTVLRFTFDNTFASDTLAYAVKTSGGEPLDVDLPAVVLKPGINYLSIRIAMWSLQSGSDYVLVMRRPDGSERKIKFFKS